MTDQEQEVLKIVKLRLDISDELDELINSYIREIGRRIRHYCNIIKIPDDLTWVWASMVVDAVRVDLPNVDEIEETVGGQDGSVKVGDTSASNGGGGGSGNGLTNISKSVIDKVVFDYRADLHHYRRMRW